MTKDYGTLSVALKTKCAPNYSDAENLLREATDSLVRATSKNANLGIQNKNPELTINTSPRYSYSTDPKNDYQTVLIDNCDARVLKDSEIAAIDLTATTFEGSTTLVFETTKKLSELSTLQQKLGFYAEDLAKENSKISIDVGSPEYALSAKLQQATQNELNAETSLQSPNKTRLSVDKDVSGGFVEEYYTEVSDSNASYKEIIPSIDNEGRSVVSAYFTFDVKFLPSNLSALSAKVPDDLLGTTQQVVKGTFVTDTDYFVGRINLSTQCQPSAIAASTAINDVFKSFKEQAENDVIDTKATSNPERVEIQVNEPLSESNWIPWERKAAQKNNLTAPQVISQINTCTGEIVKTADTQNLPKTYSSSQSITVITKNYQGLKKLQAAATQYNDGKTGQTRVQTSSLAPSPRLNPRKHFEAVEIHAYKNAVNSLLAPNGALANFLLDQVKSSEAYYSLNDYSMYPASTFPKSGGRSFGAGASPMAPQGADANDLNNYSVLATSDDNIPQAEKVSNKAYTVIYRPKLDVVAILKAKRAAFIPQKVPSRQ